MEATELFRVDGLGVLVCTVDFGRGNLSPPSVVNMLQFLNPRKHGIEGGANCAPSTEAPSVLDLKHQYLGLVLSLSHVALRDSC